MRFKRTTGLLCAAALTPGLASCSNQSPQVPAMNPAVEAASPTGQQPQDGIVIRGMISQRVEYAANGTRLIYQTGEIIEDNTAEPPERDHKSLPTQMISQFCIGNVLVTDTLKDLASATAVDSAACADGKLTPEDEKILNPGPVPTSTPPSTQTPPSR